MPAQALTISIISLAVSILGAVWTSVTFYLTQLRKSHIQLVVEKRIRIGYTDKKGFQLYIPVTLINTSYQTGIIYRFSLTFYKVDSKEPVYCIDLSRFSEMDAKENRIIDKELPHAVAVNGKASVIKMLRFVWWNNSEPSISLEPEEYQLVLLAYSKKTVKPLKVPFSFSLSAAQISVLETGRSEGGSTLTEIALNNINNNRTLTWEEARKEFKL